MHENSEFGFGTSSSRTSSTKYTASSYTNRFYNNYENYPISTDDFHTMVSAMPPTVIQQGYMCQHERATSCTSSDQCNKSPPPAPATIRWHIGETMKTGIMASPPQQQQTQSTQSHLLMALNTTPMSTFDHRQPQQSNGTQQQLHSRHSFRLRSARYRPPIHPLPESFADLRSACHPNHHAKRFAQSIPQHNSRHRELKCEEKIWRPDNFNDEFRRHNINQQPMVLNTQINSSRHFTSTSDKKTSHGHKYNFNTAQRQSSFNVSNLRIYKSIRKQRHASVQLCRDIVTGVDVVLKVLYRPVRSKDDVAREFHMQSAVHEHPNIARVLHVERVGHDIQLGVIQMCEQGDVLRMVPPNVGMSPVQALHIIKDAAEALRFMHDKRIAHGDFKPDNICITNEGEVKLIDFGLAQCIDDPNKTIGLGTPVYMAPELHQQSKISSDNTFQEPTPSTSSSSQDDVNACIPDMHSTQDPLQQQQHTIDLRAADVFAFGISLFCMLTGRFPWHSATPDNVDYKHFAHTGCPPPLQAAHFLRVHEAFEPLIYNTLKCNPLERWNMHQVCGFLGHIQI